MTQVTCVIPYRLRAASLVFSSSARAPRLAAHSDDAYYSSSAPGDRFLAQVLCPPQ
jgi:hypothetical protein